MFLIWVDILWFNVAGFLDEFAMFVINFLDEFTMFVIKLDVSSCILLGVETDAVSKEEAIIRCMIDIYIQVIIL